MNRIELRKTSPGLRDQLFNAGHIAGRQVRIRFNTDWTIRCLQLKSGDLWILSFTEFHLLDPVAKVELAATLLDVIEDRSGEPPMGRTLEQIEL